ncbi:MAG TPA: DUF4382 domain-containing protein [Terriglobales bacterium]|nr:DUF4382 domain-containing protein [Terriglobales bacterium]
MDPLNRPNADLPGLGRKRCARILTLTLLTVVWSGCSGTNSNTGSTFVVGTDAPMASVASFSVQIESVALTDGDGNTVSLVKGTPTVDFARYNGLQTLLDMNPVSGGTYTGVSITLGTGSGGTTAPILGYLNTSMTPPMITTEVATLTSPTVNLKLDKPLVVATGGGPVGLRMDFDLQKSIAVDSNGNITGMVTPRFDVRAVANTDSGGYIDEFVAAVVTPPAGTESFMVQGPHGQQFTINTTAQTEWDGGASLSALTTSSIVMVSGQLDRADSTLDADEVAILSQNGFYASGLVTYVTPPGAPSNFFDLYVRGLLPADTAVQLGNIAQVDLTGSETYSIYWMHNSFAHFAPSLFSQNGLLAGQDVAVGGPASGAANASAVTVNRVTLRHWGYIGTIVAGSQNAGTGAFQMQVNGFAGVVIPETVTVYMGRKTDFRYGFGAFNDLTDGANVRVVGLLMKSPMAGQAVLLARHVDGLNFTDFN